MAVRKSQILDIHEHCNSHRVSQFYAIAVILCHSRDYQQFMFSILEVVIYKFYIFAAFFHLMFLFSDYCYAFSNADLMLLFDKNYFFRVFV